MLCIYRALGSMGVNHPTHEGNAMAPGATPSAPDLFVSYDLTRKDGQHVMGYAVAEWPNPVSTLKDLGVIADAIKEQGETLVILNWRRMES